MTPLAVAWFLLPWLLSVAIVVRCAFEHGQGRERSRWLTTVREGAEHRDRLRGLRYILDRSIEVADHGWRGKPKLHALWPLLLVLLAGCTRPLGVAYPTRPLLTAWMEAGYPIGECADMELRVRKLTRAQVDLECGRGYGGCTSPSVAGFAGTDEYMLVRVLVGNPNRPTDKLIAHEATHALILCAISAAGDPDHKDTRMWSHYDEALGRWVEGFENRAIEVLP